MFTFSLIKGLLDLVRADLITLLYIIIHVISQGIGLPSTCCHKKVNNTRVRANIGPASLLQDLYLELTTSARTQYPTGYNYRIMKSPPQWKFQSYYKANTSY